MENLKIGMRIQALIAYSGEIIDGVITGFGEHHNRKIIDIDCNRFVYESQIIGIYE